MAQFLIKTAGTYAVTAFALIQLSSIVVTNVNNRNSWKISSERFMQLLLSSFLLVSFYFNNSFLFKKKNLNQEVLRDYEDLKNVVSNKKPKIGVIPFENLNDDKDGAFLVDGIVS